MDATVVNTCAVTNEAVSQARQTIRKLKRERADAPIIVTGCAAQTESGNVRGNAGSRARHRQSRQVDGRGFRVTRRRRRKIAVTDIMQVTDGAATPAAEPMTAAPARFCKSRTVAIIAARSALSRSAAAIRVRCRRATSFRRRKPLVEQWLSRSRAYRRRHHQLWRKCFWRAEAGRAGEADFARGAGSRATATLLNRFN